MNRLCTICARGGSKGVKNKNIRELAGRPLIAHSIIQARESGLFNYIAVSSDSQAILDVSKEWGADIIIQRPEELATDVAPKIPVIKHCVQAAEKLTGIAFHTLVDLDATSPLRLPSDIQGAVVLLETTQAPNIITGMPARRSPYFNLVELNADGFVRLCKRTEKPVVRRQDAPRCFDMNASIYVWRRKALFSGETLFHSATLLYEMPEDRSIDIDSEIDFEFVKLLMARRG